MAEWIRPQLEADMHEGEGVPLTRPVSPEVRLQLQADIGGEYVQPKPTTTPFLTREMD